MPLFFSTSFSSGHVTSGIACVCGSASSFFRWIVYLLKSSTNRSYFCITLLRLAGSGNGDCKQSTFQFHQFQRILYNTKSLLPSIGFPIHYLNLSQTYNWVRESFSLTLDQNFKRRLKKKEIKGWSAVDMIFYWTEGCKS